MRNARIAVIGDTRIENDELTDAGAIALELARGWQGRIDIGFRSVASDGDAWEAIDARFGAAGVTTWLTIRDVQDQGAGQPAALVRMGDPLNIDELFSHDLV